MNWSVSIIGLYTSVKLDLLALEIKLSSYLAFAFEYRAAEVAHWFLLSDGVWTVLACNQSYGDGFHIFFNGDCKLRKLNK